MKDLKDLDSMTEDELDAEIAEPTTLEQRCERLHAQVLAWARAANRLEKIAIMERQFVDSQEPWTPTPPARAYPAEAMYQTDGDVMIDINFHGQRVSVAIDNVGVLLAITMTAIKFGGHSRDELKAAQQLVNAFANSP